MVPMEEDIPGESRPIRAVLRAGDERSGVLVGRLPATRRWEPPTRTCSSCTPARSPWRSGTPSCSTRSSAQNAAARRARRGEGRLPAGHQPQPPDAADEHPRLRRAAGRGAAGPPARDHRRAVRPAVPDGPPAADGVAARVGRAASRRPRCCRSRPGSAGPGMRSARRRRRSTSTTTPRAGSRSPIRTSSTRSSGRCSTMPCEYGGGAAIHARRGASAGRRPARRDDRRPRARASRPEDRDRLFERYERGAAGAGAEGTGSGCTSRASCAGRWAATSCSSRRGRRPRRGLHGAAAGRAARDRELEPAPAWLTGAQRAVPRAVARLEPMAR